MIFIKINLCRKEDWGVKGHLWEMYKNWAKTPFHPTSWSPWLLIVVVLAAYCN